MTVTVNDTTKKSPVLDWFIRLIKGIIIGVGFITPGLSGGVLAVVFGLYEPLMKFLGNLTKKFVKNLIYFLPVGIGLGAGVVIFSIFVKWIFESYAVQGIWLFVGFIVGTFPSLYKTSGKQGRRYYHWIILALVAAGMFFFMHWMKTIQNVALQPSFFNWVLSGALIGLGVVVPGMSPSNFLIYLGLYEEMAHGISRLDLGVIIPLIIGGVVCVLLFARLISWLFKKYYAGMYHLILGIVVGSTLAIIPWAIKGWTIAVCMLLFLVGAAVSFFLSKLDEKYPHESFLGA